MPMMQNPDGTMTRLPYPGEPGYGGGAPMGGAPMAGRMPGTGYDQYLPVLMGGLRNRPSRLAMPRPVPRFPTPGRMDGMRLVKQRPDFEQYAGPGGVSMTRNIMRATP